MHVNSCFTNVMYRSILIAVIRLTEIIGLRYCGKEIDYRILNNYVVFHSFYIEIYGYNLGRYEEPYCREMSYRHLYVSYSPQIKITLTCIRKRKRIRILWNNCLHFKFEYCSWSTLRFFSLKNSVSKSLHN